MSVDMGANSLLLLPAGFNTATGFGSYISAGLTHTAGTILTVPAGKGFVRDDWIDDPVVCQGRSPPRATASSTWVTAWCSPATAP